MKVEVDLSKLSKIVIIDLDGNNKIFTVTAVMLETNGTGKKASSKLTLRECPF